MARIRNQISIDEKIEQQKEVVSRIKEKYDAALEELERLMRKRDEIQRKKLMEAFANSERSFEEVMRFLSGKKENDDR